MNLLIVESPTKARKIEKFLGPGWQVLASGGHIRDLPKHELGVDRGSYALTYEVTAKPETIANLRRAARAASDLYLGTDPDREGEAIAWHLQELLGLRNPKRVTFHETTKAGVLAGIAAPRRIDTALVDAQEARRGLDRLVGYDVSGALSRKTGAGHSAGRVQSIGVRLVVDREEAIRAFVAREHFGVALTFDGDVNGREAHGFVWTAQWVFKPFLPPGETLWTDRAVAEHVAGVRTVSVAECEESEARSAPPPPFTTSTLQQAGSNRLRLNPKKIMELAQSLFEKGLITYHRTDDPNLSDEAVAEIRAFAQQANLPLPDRKRTWKAKAGAQGAHEAIRPTAIALADPRTHPEADHRADGDEARLYELIRLRTIASQLADARFAVRTLLLEATDRKLQDQPLYFTARGRTLVAPGWKALYADEAAQDATQERADDPEMSNPVPALAEGAERVARDGKVIAKKTEPPPRYTQASLIKELEHQGVGRPSTYALIMEKIQARNYVEERKDRKLVPTPAGESVIGALRGRFSFVEVAFTRALEARLDDVADGKATRAEILRADDGTLQRELAAFRTATIAGIETASGGTCPTCGQGEVLRRERRTPATRKPARGKASRGKATSPTPAAREFFWACNRFPQCTATFNDRDGKPDLEPRAARIEGGTCPVCQKKPLVRRENERGPWWGCAGFKDGCKASFPDVDGAPNLTAPKTAAALGPRCPTCRKARLRLRTSARGPFWGCGGFPTCKATFEDAAGAPKIVATSSS